MFSAILKKKFQKKTERNQKNICWKNNKRKGFSVLYRGKEETRKKNQNRYFLTMSEK